MLKGSLKNLLQEVIWCLDVFKRYNEIEDILEGSFELGRLYKRLFDRDNSIKYFTECNILAKDENNIVYEVKSSHSLAEFKINSLSFGDALNLINCGVEKPEDVNIAEMTGDIYYYRSILQYHTGKLEDALFSVNKSIDTRALLKRFTKMCDSFFIKCKILIRMYELDEAQRVLDMLKLYINKENPPLMVKYLFADSILNLAAGRYRKALKSIFKADTASSKISSLEDRIMIKTVMALIFEKLKDHNQTMGTIGLAYSMYSQNLSLLDDNKFLSIKLMICYNKVRCYSGDQDTGTKEMSNTIQFLGNHELPFYKAAVNYNLGNVYLDAGEKYRAVSCFKSAKKEYEKLSVSYPEFIHSAEIIEEIEQSQDNRIETSQSK
jgi:tetratricopeptide (TPR) repeat protein